jgi:hypothetical protein
MTSSRTGSHRVASAAMLLKWGVDSGLGLGQAAQPIRVMRWTGIRCPAALWLSHALTTCSHPTISLPQVQRGLDTSLVAVLLVVELRSEARSPCWSMSPGAQ